VDAFKRDQWGVIDEACEQSLLVLDDIGAEHDPSGIGREKLYYILERRAQKWTVLTTNCPPLEWETKFESRIASRFLRNCISVDLSEVPDYGSAPTL
jgi:DNA replication protein DnaC